MIELIRTFVAIAVRRMGPEDLPASSFLLALTAVVYLLVQFPAAFIVFGVGEEAFITVIYDLGLLIVSLWLLLAVTGKRARYRQTLAAILGTSALLGLMLLPFSLWRRMLGDVEPGTTIPSAVILAIVLWSFAIDGHILSRALSRPFAVGLMVAIVYFFLHTTLLLRITPAAG